MKEKFDFFYLPYKKEDDYFVEGPSEKWGNIKSAVNKTNIDTKPIDRYRQGVEITQFKYFGIGICTPGAGNPGHRMGMSNFGSDRVRPGKDYFEDQTKFNAKSYVENLPNIYVQITNPVSYVIDSDIVDKFAFDGAIEPLTIRAKSTFFSTDFPQESHDIRGGLMAGTADQLNSSCQILTVDYKRVSPDFVPFLDAVDMSENKIPTTGFFIFDKTEILPFSDTNPSKTTSLDQNTLGSDMHVALLQMNPSTENYISHKQISATSGWDYDNNISIGTDSIAFGGMTYL